MPEAFDPSGRRVSAQSSGSNQRDGEPLIHADGLGKRFGKRWILRDLKLQVDAGEIVIITGHNGAGKSTLVRLLAGLLAPSEGVIVRPPSLGYMALDMEVYPALTGTEHLEWAGACRNCEPRTTELLETFGLTSARNRKAGAYSSGMKARLKLALAVQHRPALLILDEPTASLDEEGRDIVSSIVLSRDSAVIVATNDPVEKVWGDRAVAL